MRAQAHDVECGLTEASFNLVRSLTSPMAARALSCDQPQQDRSDNGWAAAHDQQNTTAGSRPTGVGVGKAQTVAARRTLRK